MGDVRAICVHDVITSELAGFNATERRPKGRVRAAICASP
jgi:hypothetical protein